MDRRTRIGIAWGVWITIAGLLGAFVVTPVVEKLFAPRVGGVLSETVGEFASRMASFHESLAALYYGSLTISVIGVLYSVAVWTKWFTRESVQEASH